MSEKLVLGIGNALTDMLVPASDEMLVRFSLPKGSMQLVDRSRIEQILTAVEPETRRAGGCASNTITGLGELGVKTAFIGKVGQDETGNFFEGDLLARSVESRLIRAQTPSGTAVAFITPDSERTFATHLGAAVELTADDLTPAMFSGANYFHIEGYLVQNHLLIATAIDLAKKAGAVVSIDLASYNVVEENLDFLHGLLDRGLDIIFANEDEAEAFTGLDERRALDQLASRCQVAVVKLGRRGSLIACGEERVAVNIDPVEAIDTTGAGDLYAAGFLYGVVSGWPLEACGRMGSVVAREVIQIMGAKIEPAGWDRVRQMAARLGGS